MIKRKLFLSSVCIVFIILISCENSRVEEKLGLWEKGNFVDEFGSQTGKEFLYTIVRGSHENSEVYVKSMIAEDYLSFEIYNESLNIKETFPEYPDWKNRRS